MSNGLFRANHTADGREQRPGREDTRYVKYYFIINKKKKKTINFLREK